MPFIQGEDRNQVSLLPNTLEDFVDGDNPVRVIDAYVETLDLKRLGFITYSGRRPGQKPYRRSDLLKLYIYCYMNGIRSSRKMETEATRNVELMWLGRKITPDHGTLSAFMKDNRSAIKRLFKEFTLMLKGFGFIDGNLVAIDGTKLKANSAKSNHYNENIIKKKLEYFDARIEEYIDAFLTTNDNKDIKEQITGKIDCYRSRIKELNSIKDTLKEAGITQICVTDSDAKSMKNNGKFEVCFNVQAAVDSKYNLFVAYDVVNDVNDQGQLSNMVSKAKEIFNDRTITAVADTGYYNLQQIIDAADEQTKILIKPQKGKKERSKNGFDKTDFDYDKTNDTYICPMGYVLKHKWNSKHNGKTYKRYSCEDFGLCGQENKCTSAKGGRSITRLINEEIVEQVLENTSMQKAKYLKRGSIVEHPFGTIKRHLGYTYFLTRGLKSVKTEASLIFLAYNLKRLIKIKGVRELVELFRASMTVDLFSTALILGKSA